MCINRTSMNMVIDLILIGATIVLYISFEIMTMRFLIKGLKENKVKTGRKAIP